MHTNKTLQDRAKDLGIDAPYVIVKLGPGDNITYQLPSGTRLTWPKDAQHPIKPAGTKERRAELELMHRDDLRSLAAHLQIYNLPKRVPKAELIALILEKETRQ